jgi:hypothetical protein
MAEVSKDVRVIVLCEDRQQYNFAYHFLQGCGVHKSAIRRNLPDKGIGAGEQHVREEYPKEMKEYRKHARENVALIVMIDADRYSVEDRLRYLENALSDEGLSRENSDRVAIFVPNRNIETWIYYLKGEDVDEDTDYKGPSNKIIGCKSFASPLGQKNPYHLREGVPRSLRAACGELKRIFDDKQCIRG